MPFITPVFFTSACHSNQKLCVDNVEKSLRNKSNVVILHVRLEIGVQLIRYVGRM